MGLEGIVSKRRNAPYRPGRSSNWIKVKNPDAPAVRRIEGSEDDCLRGTACHAPRRGGAGEAAPQ
jgi:ATP-dependent DNA ligase